MTRYREMLREQAEELQRLKEEVCKDQGHDLVKETRTWNPEPYSQEPYEVEYCQRCYFGVPVFA